MKRKKLFFTVLISLGLVVTGCGSEKDSNTEPTKAAEVVEINTGNSDKTGKQENSENTDNSENSNVSEEKGDKKTDETEDSSEKNETVTKTPDNETDKEEQPDIIGIGEKPGENGQDPNGDNGSSNTEQGSGSTEQGSAGSGNSGNSEQGSNGSSEQGNSGSTDQGSSGNGGSTNQGSILASDFTVSLNGNKLSCGDDFLPFVDKMGIIAKIEEGQACLEGGYDTNYYYGDVLAVYTIAKDGKQLIYDIYITGSDYPTAKGVKTGTTTKDEVRSLYGEPSSTLPAADSYVLGTKTLSIEYKGDVVSGIDISDSSVK